MKSGIKFIQKKKFIDIKQFKTNKKMSTIYKVKIFKEFTYPSSMLGKNKDIVEKLAVKNARQDLVSCIDEHINNNFKNFDASMFDVEIKKEINWKYNSKTTTNNLVSLNDIIHVLATQQFEAEYGILNVDENPEIFNIDPLGEIWLKDPFESYLLNIIDSFYTKLSVFNLDNLTISLQDFIKHNVVNVSTENQESLPIPERRRNFITSEYSIYRNQFLQPISFDAMIENQSNNEDSDYENDDIEEDEDDYEDDED